MTPEKKKQHLNRTMNWVKRHPERSKELLEKAQAKYKAKKRTEYFAITEYVVARGTALPKGTIVKAVGSKNHHLILDSGLMIPILHVRKVVK